MHDIRMAQHELDERLRDGLACLTVDHFEAIVAWQSGDPSWDEVRVMRDAVATVRKHFPTGRSEC